MPKPTETSRIELVESYFDENAKDWSDLYGKARRVNDLVLAARKDASVAHLTSRVPKGERILDAGCGAGRTSVDLMKAGYRICGVDIASKMLENAAKNFEAAGFDESNFELFCSDVFGVGFEPESFGGVAALGFLQYQSDELAALKELHRILKPGGILVVTGPTKRKFSNWFGLTRYWYALRRRLKGLGKPKPAPPPAKPVQKGGGEDVLMAISTHYYGYGRFRELLTAAGFEVVTIRGHGYVNFELIGKRIGQRGELFLHRFFSGLARVFPFLGRWANDVIAVARK